MTLRYLFTAYLTDGTEIHQTPDDISTADPLTRSAFYDVIQRLADVVSFELTDKAENTWSVNLLDGSFMANGVQFRAEPTTNHIAIRPGGTYTLVYYRDHTHTFGEDDSHVYRIGWVYVSPTGERFEQTIVIS